MYEYGARLVRVVDGDTVALDLDLGFYEWRIGRTYRLLRIDAPELNTPEGKVAKQWLEAFLWPPGTPAAKSLVAWTQKADNFGRFLVELYADNANVSDALVAAGMAQYRTFT